MSANIIVLLVAGGLVLLSFVVAYIKVTYFPGPED
jgi:hypothetical protein